MLEAISPWALLAREEFEHSRAEFEARPDFAELVEEAARRGFRRITLAEQMDCGAADAFTWCGGVWVRDRAFDASACEPIDDFPRERP